MIIVGIIIPILLFTFGTINPEVKYTIVSRKPMINILKPKSLPILYNEYCVP